MISLLSGWLTLAKMYRATQPFDGERWHFQSARFRFNSRYNGMLTIGANQEGFFMAALFLFRLGHPPLFIPWQDITVRPVKFLWFRMYRFEFRQAPSVNLRLWEKLGKRVQTAAGQSWPGDRAAAGAAF